jgi:hypothetical protein
MYIRKLLVEEFCFIAFGCLNPVESFSAELKTCLFEQGDARLVICGYTGIELVKSQMSKGVLAE